MREKLKTFFLSKVVCLFVFDATAPHWAMVSSFTRFLDQTQRRTTVGRTPLDEWSARRRDLYLTTHNTNNRQISMPPVGFETTISAGERPKTYALDRAATGTGWSKVVLIKINLNSGCICKVFWKNVCMRDRSPISNETVMRLRAFLSHLYVHFVRMWISLCSSGYANYYVILCPRYFCWTERRLFSFVGLSGLTLVFPSDIRHWYMPNRILWQNWCRWDSDFIRRE